MGFGFENNGLVAGGTLLGEVGTSLLAEFGLVSYFGPVTKKGHALALINSAVCTALRGGKFGS